MSSMSGESSSSNSEAPNDYHFVEFAAAKIGLVYENGNDTPQVGIVVPGSRGEGDYLALLPTAKIELTSEGWDWSEMTYDGKPHGPGVLSYGIKLKKNDADPAS